MSRLEAPDELIERRKEAIKQIVIYILATLAIGFALSWLWNELMPEIFKLPTISFWQAVGLSLMGHMICNGWRL